MPTIQRIHHRLGYRILRWVLVTALLVGILLSSLQIILDAQRVSEELDGRARETLSLVKDAATQAVYSIDEELARQVTSGLFEQTAIRYASIMHTDGTALSTQQRALMNDPLRGFTDAIFQPERLYQVPLSREGRHPISYGYLEIKLDTAQTAHLWLERAIFTFVSGILRAVILSLVLYFVYHFLLTRPLLRIIRSISEVDPEDPSGQLIAIPAGHHADELGLWVNSSNKLLLSIGESQHKQRVAEAKASRLSRYDHLTGLPNRELFLHTLGATLLTAGQDKQSVALYCFGLDDFKGINEQHGYPLGDRILQMIADQLIANQRGYNLSAARLGSDQFVLMETGVGNGYRAAETAERILQLVAQPLRIDDQEIAISATIGISIFPEDADTPNKLLQRAEQTMTLAKIAGRNQFQFYVASVDQEIRERKKLERDLSQALGLGQFHLVYQPQINLETQRIVGAEALIRWIHPERGFVPPDQFIPIAELSHTIIDIGTWVLDEACRQAALWMRKGYNMRIAVNLSAVQLRQPDLVKQILTILAKHQLPASQLELEITETGFMDDITNACDKLSQLCSKGIQVAVDDFGTGYSSLTYLKRLPVQRLKIDKQFIFDLLAHDEDTQIANTIIDLGKNLNLEVIAEGVEEKAQADYLQARGCILAQGYYFSKPVLPDDFEKFVHRFHTTEFHTTEKTRQG